MSSFVIATPGILASAAEGLTGLEETIGAANAAAASSTTHVLTAAGDEVSAAIARLFGTYGDEYQALSAQAAKFHAQFVQALNAGAREYAAVEAANASRLQTLGQDALAVTNAHAEALLGHPLIGTGSTAPAAATQIYNGPIPWFPGTLTMNQVVSDSGAVSYSGNLAVGEAVLAPLRLLTLGAVPANMVASFQNSAAIAVSQLLGGQVPAALQTLLLAPLTAVSDGINGTYTLTLPLPDALVQQLSSGAITSATISLGLGPQGTVGPAVITVQPGSLTATVTLS
ncbi:PE-PGRS family protein PE_PGRS16 [Mycobacterium simulans]|uniref:PE-PGRS family protein PE_PGRS16 n=1 Tax=Mycobacterium simulans TaxID=627089 RepID=A0A7Z7ILE9_9MYCO|nr:PE-PGRS family protein PE_PGRS16 [Mycobacterium simulans]